MYLKYLGIADTVKPPRADTPRSGHIIPRADKTLVTDLKSYTYNT